ncbi:hypothetical protein TNCV_2990521 [Trichonephila clavipes]|nr:hypothetical protein TNCV_2990521 [Trichonephila clavipes]
MTTTEMRLPTLSNRSEDFKNVMKKMKKPGGHAMQKTGFPMLNDDDIVTSVQEESISVDNETDEDEDNITKVARVHQKILTRFLSYRQP